VLSLTVITTLRYQQERSVTDRRLQGVLVIPVSVRTGGSMDLPLGRSSGLEHKLSHFALGLVTHEDQASGNQVISEGWMFA
jgi:hypothetical protein